MPQEQAVQVIESDGAYQVIDTADPKKYVVHATYLCSRDPAFRRLAKLQAEAFRHGFLYARHCPAEE